MQVSGWVRQGLSALLVLGVLAGSTVAAQDEGDPVLFFDPEDPAMNEAVANARSTLDNVLERVATEGIPAEALSLKVAIPKDGGGHENIWLQAIVQIDETTFEGLLANAPQALPGMKQGDRHRFGHHEITDWTFFAGEQMHGAYTLRVMLPRLPAAQAEEFRRILAPLP